MNLNNGFILKERVFRDTQFGGALNMLLEEWNMEDAIAYAKKEGREEGHSDGQDYVLELLDQGFSTDEIKQRIYSC